jgi:hypothetical protein
MNGFLLTKSNSFFHNRWVGNMRFCIAHRATHVLFEADNKERDLVHQHGERGIGRIPDKFGLIYIEVNLPYD